MKKGLLQRLEAGPVICAEGYLFELERRGYLQAGAYVPEVVLDGSDITVVSYGSTLRVVLEAAQFMKQKGIHCEVIDVQTLLPFDIHHSIVASLKKTNRILFVDEDVPGGAAAYMFNKVMEEQAGYRWLDVAPRTITAKPHRPAYGSDGDYFSKPNAEEIEAVIKQMMAE